MWHSLCDIFSFVLPCLLDIIVVEVWLVDSLAWVLRLRCNLTDFEIQEYATLSASLSIVRFRLVPNS